MSSPSLTLLGGAAVAISGAVVAYHARRPTAVDAAAVLAGLDGARTATDEFSKRLAEPLAARLLRPLAGGLTRRVAGLLPHNRLDKLRHRLVLAGTPANVGAEEFIVIQALAIGAGALLTLAWSLVSGSPMVGALRMAALMGFVGWAFPQRWLARKRRARVNSIRRDLPDVLDLLAISVEAGVSFEGALAVVTRHFTSPLSTELARTLRETELGLPRRAALTNLKRRTDVRELSSFITILVQADVLGMPIGRIIRTQAIEMRSKRRQWAREKAGKLPVKILIPLVLFILPSLFVVVIGPAVISIAKNL